MSNTTRVVNIKHMSDSEVVTGEEKGGAMLEQCGQHITVQSA